MSCVCRMPFTTLQRMPFTNFECPTDLELRQSSLRYAFVTRVDALLFALGSSISRSFSSAVA